MTPEAAPRPQRLFATLSLSLQPVTRLNAEPLFATRDSSWLQGGTTLTLTTSNLLLTSASSASLRLSFGSLVTGATLITADAALKTSTIQATVPAFVCATCLHTGGAGHTTLYLSLGGASPLAQTAFTFWRAPEISSCRFGSGGLELAIQVDQPTNMGGLPGLGNAAVDCASLFVGGDGKALSGLGEEAKCAWQTRARVRVLLGRGAAIKQGDTIGQMHADSYTLHSAPSPFSLHPIPCTL